MVTFQRKSFTSTVFLMHQRTCSSSHAIGSRQVSHLLPRYFNKHLQLHLVVSFPGIAKSVQFIRAVRPSHAASCCFQNSASVTSHLHRCTHGRRPHSSVGCFPLLADRACRCGPPVALSTWNCLEPFRRHTHTHTPPVLFHPPLFQPT